MISEAKAKIFCCEDISLIENYDEAVNSSEKYDVQHKLGLWFNHQWLIDNGFYYEQRAEMLMFIEHGEHSRLHQTNRRHSDETKRKISEKKSGEYHQNFGKHLSNETKRKIGEAQKGEKHHFFGKHHSEETKHKLRVSLLNNHYKSKKVCQYTMDGKFVAAYPSAHEAERQTGVNLHHISSCCNGKRKSAGGFIWRHA